LVLFIRLIVLFDDIDNIIQFVLLLIFTPEKVLNVEVLRFIALRLFSMLDCIN